MTEDIDTIKNAMKPFVEAMDSYYWGIDREYVRDHAMCEDNLIHLKKAYEIVSQLAPQSIETLPSSIKHKQVIIDLWYEGERYPECWWFGERWISYIAGNTDKVGDEPWEEVRNPTHWMKIPHTPK